MVHATLPLYVTSSDVGSLLAGHRRQRAIAHKEFSIQLSSRNSRRSSKSSRSNSSSSSSSSGSDSSMPATRVRVLCAKKLVISNLTLNNAKSSRRRGKDPFLSKLSILIFSGVISIGVIFIMRDASNFDRLILCKQLLSVRDRVCVRKKRIMWFTLPFLPYLYISQQCRHKRYSNGNYQIK